MMDERDKNILNYFQETDHLDSIDNFQDCGNDEFLPNDSVLNEINGYSSFRNSSYENMSATSEIIKTHQNPLGDLPFHSIGSNEERILETREEDILDFFLDPFHFEPADESHADLRQNPKDQPHSLEYILVRDEFHSSSLAENKRNTMCAESCSSDFTNTEISTSVCTLGKKRKYLEPARPVKTSNFPEISEFSSDRDENKVNAEKQVCNSTFNDTKTYQIDECSRDDIFSNNARLFSVPGGLSVADTSRFNYQPDMNVPEKHVKDDEISQEFLKGSGAHDQNYQYADERYFACHKCPKRFMQKDHLKRHLVVHSEERPFKCDECGKGFKLKGNLTRHAQSYSQEKTFACHFCSERFGRKSSLTRHLQVHSDERPFTCRTCCKGFKRKEHLNRHVSTHSNEKAL